MLLLILDVNISDNPAYVKVEGKRLSFRAIGSANKREGPSVTEDAEYYYSVNDNPSYIKAVQDSTTTTSQLTQNQEISAQQDSHVSFTKSEEHEYEDMP